MGEGEEKQGVEKHAQDFVFYVEDVKHFLLNVLGKDDGAESDARDGDEECGKGADVGPKVSRALHVLPADVSRRWSY